jgi:hypothetical protein
MLSSGAVDEMSILCYNFWSISTSLYEVAYRPDPEMHFSFTVHMLYLAGKQILKYKNK